MKNYDYWKKSQITDISTFCYWLHQQGVGIYANGQNCSIFIQNVPKYELYEPFNIIKKLEKMGDEVFFF